LRGTDGEAAAGNNEVDAVALTFPFQPPPPPRLGPEWSTWIVIIAIMFFIAVFAFYFYVR